MINGKMKIYDHDLRADGYTYNKEMSSIDNLSLLSKCNNKELVFQFYLIIKFNKNIFQNIF